MLRDILTNKWFIGGCGFLIVFAVLCHLWYRHDTTSFKKQLSITDEKILQREKSNKAQETGQRDGPLTEPFQSVRDKSESVRDTSVPTERTTEETDTIEKNKNINLTADSQTSPFGFGPYPEVPVDYPFQERLWDNATPEHELLVRVRVKLWKQGTKTKGAMFDTNNGLIYPSIPGVIYVQWRTVEDLPDFVGRRYTTLIMGDENTAETWQSSYLTEGGYEPIDVNNDIETSGIKVYEYPDGGIDPYNFLDLPR